MGSSGTSSLWRKVRWVQPILLIPTDSHCLSVNTDNGEEDSDEDWADELDEEVEEEIEEDYEDEDDEDENLDDADSEYGRCQCNFHASHWSGRLNRHRLYLDALVQERLLTLFKESPSLRIYTTILAISKDTKGTQAQLHRCLAEIACSSSDTFAAALDIYASECSASNIISILDSHSYLLRPRDAPSFQCAVLTVGQIPHLIPRAIQLLEKELLSTISAIYSTVQANFSLAEEPANQTELAKICKLPAGTQQRASRVESWVEAVMTPSAGPMHPVAFAAMMMGFPTPGFEESEEADLVGYLDMGQADPDYDDLREEFRPKLKERFAGWVATAHSIKGGFAVLTKMYTKMAEMMPFLKATDIPDEMCNRYVWPLCPGFPHVDAQRSCIAS